MERSGKNGIRQRLRQGRHGLSARLASNGIVRYLLASPRTLKFAKQLHGCVGTESEGFREEPCKQTQSPRRKHAVYLAVYFNLGDNNVTRFIHAMAKAKSTKSGKPGIPQKHLRSRLSYLHQAATLLTTARLSAQPDTAASHDKSENPDSQIAGSRKTCTVPSRESNRLLSHLRGVSRKSQLRLSPAIKRTICKRCDSLLIAGMTSSATVVNDSKDATKSWADVFEIRCKQCDTVKRFPVGLETVAKKRLGSPEEKEGKSPN